MSAPALPLILNVNARGSKTSKLLAWAQSRKDDFHCMTPGSQEEARSIVRALVEAGAPTVVAAGGDGTLNLVANELIGSSTTLGIIPAGTMNVFARELQLPLNNYDAALQIIRKGNISEVDIFRANGIPFLQMCGVGFDAEVVVRTTWENKKKWGILAYIRSVLATIKETPPVLILRTPEGEVHEGVFAVMGNGSLYAGQFKLFPEAVYDDGLLDIILFKKIGSRLILSQLLRAFFRKNTLPNPKHALYLRLPSCEIESSNEVPVELDGDVKGKTPLTVKLSSEKLKVITP